MTNRPFSVGIVHVDFEELDPSTYKGVRVTLGGRHEASFTVFTGLPHLDYYLATKIGLDLCQMLMNSSSVDHFVQDGGSLHIPEPSIKHVMTLGTVNYIFFDPAQLEIKTI